MDHPLPLFFVCVCLALTACGDGTTDGPLPEGIAPSAAERTNTAPAAPRDLPKAPSLNYTLPEGWTVGPAKEMRFLTLLPPAEYEGAELAIARWPGDVGGFAPNVKRWMGEVGLTFEVQPREAWPQMTVGDTQAAYLPLTNMQANQTTLALWVPRGDTPDQPAETWTFKLTCTAKQALELEAAFKEWAESVVFE